MGEDRSRPLGVVEAIVATRDQCPSGAVRQVAAAALEAIKTRAPGVLRQQAFLVLTATRGWRGERADRVRRSLDHYLRSASSDAAD